MQVVRSHADELAILGNRSTKRISLKKSLMVLVMNIIYSWCSSCSRNNYFFRWATWELLNNEHSIHQLQAPSLSLPITSNMATTNEETQNNKLRRSPNPQRHHQQWCPSPFPGCILLNVVLILLHVQPYLGKFQACGTQGHTAKICLTYKLTMLPSSKHHTPRQPTLVRLPTPWQPRAHYAKATNTGSPTWLLDSGAFHHVTTDLSNISLH